MWQQTYERLSKQAIEAEMLADEAFVTPGQAVAGEDRRTLAEREFLRAEL
jgi:hypothetical protein